MGGGVRGHMQGDSGSLCSIGGCMEARDGMMVACKMVGGFLRVRGGGAGGLVAR
jgi:hypothetical protein